MLKKLSASLQLVMVLLFTVFATNAATLVTAHANGNYPGGSDSPTPYTVTAESITLPAGDTFEANGHINYRVTKLDGTGEQSFNVQDSQPGNGVWPNEQYIGKSVYAIQDHPQFPASYKTDGYCVTWVQISLYNQHFGEGHQAPACTTTPLTKVTATAPTFIDLCGTANDRYTVPSTEHITYNPAAGPYTNASGTVTVTASADQGYVLMGDSTFTFTFTDVACPTPDVPIAAGSVTFTDTCGTNNDTVTIPNTPNVTYKYNDSVVSGTIAARGTVTITAEANHGYVLTTPYTFTHTFNGDACPPTVKQCTTLRGSTDVRPSNLEGFTFSETRATGHYDFTNNGLHIWTESNTSTDKVAAYKAVNVALADVGNPALNYTNNGGVLPGYQLYIDNGHGVAGYVVGEPASYGNNWWSNKDFGIGGGAGYASYGTLDQYLAANPDARVLAFGFSLGSGVKGDGVLKDITFNCYKWVFKADKDKPVTLCHASNWYKDSYDQITVKASKAYVHYLFDSKDIIPAFTYHGQTVPAKNWTPENQDIYNHGCKKPKPPVQCPTGTTWEDANNNHKVDSGECVAPPPADVCENIDGNQADLPAGYVYDDEGNCVQPGGKGGDDTEEVDTTTAQVLGITTPTTNTAELANTGADTSTTLLTVLLGFTVISLALGSTFAVRKQRN